MSDNINKYNSEGKRDGLWKYYHDNGNIWYEGNYINSKEDGLWKEYNNNGDLIEEIFYVR